MSEPAQITSIRPTQRDPHRATVRVGRKAVATLALRQIEALDLAVGQPWDDALAQRVAEAADEDKAMRQALNRLNRRAMSRRDLDRKLRDLGYSEPARGRVLDRLTAQGWLDDEAFGRALIRETQRRKPAGPRLLQHKLFQKGLDRALVDRLIAESRQEHEGDATATEQALALARQQLPRMQRLDAPTRQRRLYGLLARRGFEPDTIDEAMKALRRDMHV